MTDLRDRLAKILASAHPSIDFPEWNSPWERDRDHWREIADALLTSEEWRAREAVVEAARVLVGVGTGQQTQGAQHLLAERSAWKELRAALARLDVGKGEETMTANVPVGQALAQAREIKALKAECDGLKHTLEMWSAECGEGGPRPIKAEVERLTKITGLQRAALDVWKRAHPHEQNPGACSLEEVSRWRNACYAARGILRGLEGSPEAALAAVEKLEWAIGGAPDPEDETYQKVVTFLHERGRSGWANWAEDLMTIVRAAEADVKALAEALEGLMQWGVELDDKRLDYVSVQIARSDIGCARAALARDGVRREMRKENR